MALKDDIKAKADQKAKASNAQQNQPRVNPEIDARLNQFMTANPKLVSWYREQDKELLVRKLMLARMNKADQSLKFEEKVKQWVEQNPEVKARVLAKIQNVPQERQQAAFVSVARNEMANKELRSVRQSP